MNNWNTTIAEITFNKECNHGIGYDKEELSEMDKKVMLRTQKGLQKVLEAIEGFKEDYSIGFGKAGRMNAEENNGFNEVADVIEDAIDLALEDIYEDLIKLNK
jgi:hypothetical protein